MSTLATLKLAIASHTPWDADEAAMQQAMLLFVDKFSDCLWRTQLQGHITASAWVLDESSTQVLLIHHRKLDRWLQPGGHADGEANTLAVAQREVLEETGLETEPISATIFDLDIHEIPARGSEPIHCHYDIRYLLRPRPGSHLQINHEVKAAEWVPLAHVQTLTTDRSLLRMVDKILSQNTAFSTPPLL
jgi:8-oxo-dGTP pyrophosphatase MutT (NUDIX family)